MMVVFKDSGELSSHIRGRTGSNDFVPRRECSQKDDLFCAVFVP